MSIDGPRWTIGHPWTVVVAWVALALAVGLAAPDLTRLAAEGQAKLLPKEAESARAAEELRRDFPDLWYESLAVAALHRPGGLTAADRDHAAAIMRGLLGEGRPEDVLRVLGPASEPSVAARLVSDDRSVQLVVAQLGKSFVAPSTQRAVGWLQARAASVPPPAGLQVLWTGDAVVGRDYMAGVQTTLDRAALATVFLLLIVLLIVYRSLLLALVPLITIGLSLVISRSALGAMAAAGWEVSPLVELFLIVLLFGCGTDFCLFISWRYGEHFDADDPRGAMRSTLRRSMGALSTSAATVMVGLCLMGVNRFKLFSSTGPSVAIGLAITLAASLSLTPALLVLLATHRPRSFRGLTRPASGLWERVGHAVLAHPWRTWALGVLAMMPLAAVGMSTTFTQDIFLELPPGTVSVDNLRLVASKFGEGSVAPLTIILDADSPLNGSAGLALIDDFSRWLAQDRRHQEVRSATQPLGTTETLERARLSSRLAEVDAGDAQIADGAGKLRDGLNQGAAKLRTAIQLQELTGLPLAGPMTPADKEARDAVTHGLRQSTAALLGLGGRPAKEPAKGADNPRELLIREITRAAEGAGRISDGARRAHEELSAILADPVGRRALDRLLVTPSTIRDNPALLQSFAAYLSKDGRRARIDVVQKDRVFSGAALDGSIALRSRLAAYLGGRDEPRATALVTGANAESADIRDLTRRDQLRTWVILPTGIFLVLLILLRDPWACANLVVTMLLTYAFALGAAHVLFVNILGGEGLDWKVPYFLFVLLVAIGVDYNIFLMVRVREEAAHLGLKAGIGRAVGQTGGLISSAAAITACSFAAMLFSPLGSLRQLGFALVVGITFDAALVRPVLVPCGQWLLGRGRERSRLAAAGRRVPSELARVGD